MRPIIALSVFGTSNPWGWEGTQKHPYVHGASAVCREVIIRTGRIGVSIRMFP